MLKECASSQLIPTPFSKGGLAISHLIFVVDVMIFAKASNLTAANLKSFLDPFGSHTGLIINEGKSSAFFYNCDVSSKNAISSVLTFQEKNLPMRYLGLPLFSTCLKLEDCQHIIKNMK